MKSLAYYLIALLLPGLITCRFVMRASDSQSQPDPTQNRSGACTSAFDANTDFYGFGIRLGVYFQWVASWLSNTFAPENNHDANSIFVLATAIAIAVAMLSSALKPAEAYIMFSICYGFFFTVLTFLGIRIHFLEFEAAGGVSKEFMRRKLAHLNLDVPKNRSAGFFDCAFLQTQFTTAAFGKLYSLSWCGMIARSAICSLVCALNIYFWFCDVGSFDASPDTSCGKEVFLFSSIHLNASAREAFEKLAILLAVVPFYLCLISSLMLILVFMARSPTTMVYLTGFTLEEDSNVSSSSNGANGPAPEMSHRERWMNAFTALLVHDADLHESHTKLKPTPALQSPETANMGDPGLQYPPWKEDIEVSNLIAYLFGVDTISSELIFRLLSICFVVVMHSFVAATIVCFIVFIEKTIQLNHIHGAYAIKSTGQLIPFVIGTVSMISTAKDIVVKRMKDVSLEIFPLSWNIGRLHDG